MYTLNLFLDYEFILGMSVSNGEKNFIIRVVVIDVYAWNKPRGSTFFLLFLKGNDKVMNIFCKTKHHGKKEWQQKTFNQFK